MKGEEALILPKALPCEVDVYDPRLYAVEGFGETPICIVMLLNCRFGSDEC